MCPDALMVPCIEELGKALPPHSEMEDTHDGECLGLGKLG